MLAYLSGIITTVDHQEVTIEPVQGIGLQIAVPLEASYCTGKKALIHTYLHWNQEQGPSLFGFENEIERAVFMLIISCSGLGPKIGLASLGELGAAGFLQAIQSDDSQSLSRIPGIGQKKAEQIAVQLKHKAAKLLESGALANSGEVDGRWHELSQALQSLNYTRTEISSALAHVRDATKGNQVAFDQMMRHALSFLSKMR